MAAPASTIPSVQKVKNPKTGRMITVGKDVYNKLIAEGYVLRGSTLVKDAPGIGSITAGMSQMTVTPPVITPPPSQPIISPPVVTPPPSQPIIPQPIISQPITSPPPVTIGKTEVPAPATVTVHGPVPVTTGLRTEFIESIRQDRKEMCGICQSEYVTRISNLRPFMKSDYDLLKKRVSPACDRCVNLVEQEIRLAGRDPNAFETYRRYNQASIQAKQRLGQLESQIRTEGIQMASAGTTDPGIFFPSVPGYSPQ